MVLQSYAKKIKNRCTRCAAPYNSPRNRSG